jgi:hypothetical protein
VREEQEPNTPLTAVVGLVFAILLFVLVVVLQAYFYRADQEENVRKVVAQAPEELSQLLSQQEEKLHSYKILDPKKGVVAIPIDVAMKLVVRDGGKTPWPEVQPPPVPTPGAASTAPAKPAAPVAPSKAGKAGKPVKPGKP